MNALASSTVYRQPADLVPRGKAPGARAQLLSDINGRITYALVLARGDEVATALMDFASAHHIAAAHFTAIGALCGVTVAWYDLERKAYKIIAIEGQVEALTLLGDVGLAKGIPAVHCHMTVGLEDGTVRGGHLVGATASPTLEIMLIVEPGVLQKQFDACSGLTLFRPG
jgi:predicted DNA-binding protein with PD1-like motif